MRRYPKSLKPPYPLGKCAICKEKRKLIKRRPRSLCFRCNREQIEGYRAARQIQIREAADVLAETLTRWGQYSSELPDPDEKVEWPESIEVK